jgi:NAD(P)-dependent dehydrogenase (short-subunit alcohol dehydrogenase family)
MGRDTLAGRVAVVTGAGDGIGRGVATRFAAEGARVVIAEIDAAGGEKLAADLRGRFAADVIAVPTDVSVKADVRAVIATAHERWGRLDVLVNNAWSTNGIGRVENRTDEAVERGLAIGFRGPLWAMQFAFPIMKSQRYGRVINMCSLNGVNAHMGTLEYNVAKEALRTATRTAAREWAAHGITVNAICPGAKSAATRRVFAEHPELEAAADAANPMGRLGDPERDIAPVAVFLAGEDASYLTGNTLFVDGGTHINGAAWAPEMPDDA